MITVLIVDDDPHIRELLGLYLRKEGYVTLEVADGEEALLVLEKERVQLAIIDIMMPNIDGYELCEEIRKLYDIPIIMLTAKGEIDDKEKAYKAGTDDYIVKPFTHDELVARIYAVLRRSGANIAELQQKYVVFGPIKIDEIARKVSVDGKSIPLTLKEFELLHLFMKNPGNAYTREQLLERIWDIDYVGGTRTVDTHIKTLRIKLGKEAAAHIQTVWGVGYRFDPGE